MCNIPTICYNQVRPRISPPKNKVSSLRIYFLTLGFFLKKLIHQNQFQMELLICENFEKKLGPRLKIRTKFEKIQSNARIPT